MDNFNFDYNFSNLNLVKLHQEAGITSAEITSVFENPLSTTLDVEGFKPQELFFNLIGFSSKSRFLFVVLNYSDEKINFYRATIANESQIRTYYCGK